MSNLFSAQRAASLEVETSFPPYGLAHLDTFEPAMSLDEVRMTPTKFAHIASYCGSTRLDNPTDVPRERIGLADSRPVNELEHSYTVPSGGLLGFVLMSTTRHIAMQSLGVQSVEDLVYETPDGRKCMDSGLGSGYMVMGRMAEEVIKASRAVNPNITDTELLEVLSRSYRSLPREFANMANDSNKKLEMLYDLRRRIDDKKYIAEELEICPEKSYGFAMDQGRVVPENWDHASSDVSRRKSCPALEHPVFGSVWQLISRSAVKLL